MVPRRPVGRARVLLLFFVVAVMASACGGSSTRPTAGRYDNARLGYGFYHPVDWPDLTGVVRLEVRGNEQPDILDDVAWGHRAENKLLSGVHVTVVQIRKTVAESEVESELEAMDDSFRQLARNAAGRLLPPETATLAGRPARQWIIEFAYAGETQAASVQTATFVGNRQFIVNCIGPTAVFNDEILPGCELVLNSFQIN